MVGVGCDELGERGSRLLHELGSVTEDVDRSRRQVGGADALGQHAHARTPFGQLDGGGQAGHPAPEHDHVVLERDAHGRCPMSSTPWKIQSSNRA